MSLDPPEIEPDEQDALRASQIASQDAVVGPEPAKTELNQSSDTDVVRTDLSAPRFLHPSSVVFETISHVRRYIIPAAIWMFSAARGSSFGASVAFVVFGSSLAITLLKYFTLRYRIQGNDFIVTEGLLFRRVRSVPIRRIQNMDLVQNVLHRVMGVAEVKIETASGTEPEAVLRVLTRAQIEELRFAIFGTDTGNDVAVLSQPRAGLPSENSDEKRVSDAKLNLATQTSSQPTSVSAISVRQLVLAGLASNRGIVLLGIAIGFLYQGDWTGQQNYRFRFSTSFLKDYLPEQPNAVLIGLIVCLAFLTLMVALRIAGIAWYVLRFFDYRLTRSGDDLRISCGLFTKVSATIPRKRIQFISVHRSLIMRMMHLASIRIETAGGSGSVNENAAATVSRRWFLPVIREVNIARVLSELRPGIDWDPSSVDWHGVSPLTGRRLLRVALIASILISGIGIAISRPWGWLAGVAIFPPLLWLAWKKSKARKYARTDWGIAYQSGLFTRKLSFAFYDRIQTLNVSQTPFDRRWQMATLRIDTAAAGPAEHLIDVHYLDADFAFEQFGTLQTATAEHRPSWA